MEQGTGINLGAGRIHWEGWTAAGHGCELECDLRAIPVPDNAYPQACAIHVIEHFYRWEVPALLLEWKRILAPGGTLILELPSLDKVFYYISDCLKSGKPILERFSTLALWGDPHYQDPLMCHRWGYTQAQMKELMEQAGFVVHVEPPRYHFKQRDMRLVGVKP